MIDFTLTIPTPIHDRLRNLEGKAGQRIARKAVRAAANQAKAAIVQLAPFRQKNRRATDKRHFRDTISIRQRTYKKGTISVCVVGAKSPQVPHAHLIEFGTVQRFTNSRTIYATTGRRQVRVKGKGIITRLIRRRSGTAIRDAGRKQANRGVMPEMMPVRRGLQQSQAAAQATFQRIAEYELQKIDSQE